MFFGMKNFYKEKLVEGGWVTVEFSLENFKDLFREIFKFFLGKPRKFPKIQWKTPIDPNPFPLKNFIVILLPYFITFYYNPIFIFILEFNIF